MEKNEQQEKIGSKYIIKEKIALGGQAKIFLVEDKEKLEKFMNELMNLKFIKKVEREIN